MTLRHDQQQSPLPDELAPIRSHIHGCSTWKVYIFLATLLFILFYFLIPAWLNHELHFLQNNAIRPIAEPLLIRHIDWLQWLGITLSSICMLLAIRNYVATRPMARSDIHFISRLLAKLMN